MMNRTQRAEIGLRPALSRNETQAGQLARTYVELSNRELSAIRWEMSSPVRAVVERAEDAAGIAEVKAAIDAYNEWRAVALPYSECASYWAALP